MNYKEKLNKVETFVFDVDGVLTDGTVLALPNQEPIRSFNSKDGYALQLAVRKGYKVAQSVFSPNYCGDFIVSW